MVFVGINPGETSARRGHYYAHPGNRFWAALSASGLVPCAVVPDDDAWLGEACGIGFTDVVKRVVTDSTRVTAAEAHTALPACTRRIAAARPRVVCFTAGRACDEVFSGAHRASGWGRLAVTLSGASGSPASEVCVTPSASGRAVRWRAEGASVLRELAAALGHAHPPGSTRPPDRAARPAS